MCTGKSVLSSRIYRAQPDATVCPRQYFSSNRSSGGQRLPAGGRRSHTVQPTSHTNFLQEGIVSLAAFLT